jgi:hypothetical protein
MRPRPLARRAFSAPAAGLVLVLAIAACSSSSSSPGTSSTSASASTPSASSSAGTSSGAAAAVAANWAAFFSGSTSAAKKLTLLQNGQTFASVVSSLAALGSSTSAKVTSVTLTSPTKATVKYDILEGGATALPGQTGTAVLQDGTWKVSDASLCTLLALAQQHPSACSSAG